MHKRFLAATWLAVAVGLPAIGCRAGGRPYVAPPTAEALHAATVIPYYDSEAFDAMLEAALTRQDPVIVIQTATSEPDWSGRLNAWIAAWNEGGPVQPPPQTKSKGIGLPRLGPKSVIELPPNTAEEARLLIEGEIDRIERLARESVAWWRDEQKRKARAAMLKPYVLRVQRDPAQRLQVVLNR